MSQLAQLHSNSGNVFQDIGFPVAEAERELLKANLAFEIHTILEKRKLSQAKAGQFLGLYQTYVSRLKNGNFDCFSVERMFTILNQLACNAENRYTPSGNSGRHQCDVAV